MASILEQVAEAYADGRYLDAYACGRPLGPVQNWPGTEGRVLAGRLIAHLGAERLSWAIRLRAYRSDPTHADAQYYALWAVLSTRSPWKAWRLAQEIHTGEEPPRHFDSRQWADWLAIRARLFATFRDFDAADACIRQALEVAPQSPWIHVEHAGVLWAEDQYAQALEAALRSMEFKPWFRPAVQSAASLHVLLGDMAAGMRLLYEAAERLQCAQIWLQLASLHHEMQQPREALDALDCAERMMPLIEPKTAKGLILLRRDAHDRLGEREQAAAWALKLDKHFFDKELARHLNDPQRTGERKLLDVPFVRQHHVTCAPATLTAICHYWNKPADHLEIAEEICYDGTPWHSERQWVEDRGFVVREFRTTPQAARELVDRGLPFTLTTVNAANAHLQAICGYDTLRGVLLMRDPYIPHIGEMLADRMHEAYGATGPRGMVFVPQEEAYRLEGLDLPDQDAFDHYYHLQRALLKHDRAAAVQAAGAIDPGHMVALWANLSLAQYDAHLPRAIESVDALLEHFPKNQMLQMRRLALAEQLQRRDDAIDQLRTLAADAESELVFTERLISLLSEDGRYRAEADRLLRKLLRKSYVSPPLLHTIGSMLWRDHHRRPEAIEAYRFASTMADKNESYAMSYFVCQQHLRQTDQALAKLTQSAQRYAHKNAGPTLTCYRALKQVGRVDAGLQLLEQSLERKPDDGELLRQLTVELALFGRTDQAQSLLPRVRQSCRYNDYLRCAAVVADYTAQLQEALDRFNELVELEPLDIAAQRRVVQLLTELQGPDAALSYVKALSERFAHHAGVRELQYEVIEAYQPEASRAALEAIVTATPDNVWAIRQLAFTCLAEGDLSQAVVLHAQAEAVDADAAGTLHLAAQIAVRQDRVADAQAIFRNAIEMDGDNIYAIEQLFALSADNDSRREAAEFVAGQLMQQTLFGEGVVAFIEMADDVLAPEALLKLACDHHASRPDLWSAWVALMRMQVRCNQLDPAAATAEEAVQAFPLLSRLWIEKSHVHHVRLELPQREHALQQAVQVDPFNVRALHELADTFTMAGEIKRALTLIDQAITRDPRNVAHHAKRAVLLWHFDHPRDAVAVAEHALALSPVQAATWNRYAVWCQHLDDPARAIRYARKMLAVRPGDPQLHLQVAQVLAELSKLAQAVLQVEKAIELEPRLLDAHDLRVRLLVELRRFDEAQAACRPKAFGEHLSAPMQARAAWVQSRRGNLADAIVSMQKLLEREPNLYWGWEQLALWLRHNQDNAGSYEAAKNLVRLAPHSTEALHIAGLTAKAVADHTEYDAEQEKFREEARTLCQRSFDLDPRNTPPGEMLLNMLCEDQRIDEARQLLQRLKPHLYSDYVMAYEIRIDEAAERYQQAIDALPQLAARLQGDAAALQIAVDRLAAAPIRWRRKALKALREAVHRDGATNLLAARSLVRWHLQCGTAASMFQEVRRLQGSPQKWTIAALAALQSAEEASTMAQAIQFIHAHRRRFVASGWWAADELWATAVDLASRKTMPSGRRYYHLASRIGQSWKGRTNLSQWMLTSVAYALCGCGRYHQAVEVVEAAMKLPPDASQGRLLMLGASACLGAGDVEKAGQLYRQAMQDPDEGRYFAHVAQFNEAMLAAVEHPDVQEGFASARCLYRGLPIDQHRRDNLFKHLHALTLRTLPARVGGYRALLGRLRSFVRLTGLCL